MKIVDFITDLFINHPVLFILLDFGISTFIVLLSVKICEVL